MEHLPESCRLAALLRWCESEGASDLHLRANLTPMVRVDGRLHPVPESESGVLDDTALHGWLIDAFSTELVAKIISRRELDASFYHGTTRYRANFSKQRGCQACSFRIVPQHRFSLEDLQLPDSLCEVVREPRGLVFVTGPTGQGKSTTVRALLQHINATEALRIITVEDPIEYVFTDDQSHFEQREVGMDTASFADGIRNAMRQDPDVIFIGEIRDRESIWAGMQAAETGHLVLTTLHADSVAQAVGRIREFYPEEEKANISALLARNLNAIICQRLIPNVENSRTPCVEILRRDAGVQDALRNHQTHLLTGIVESANFVGMHSFDQYLTELLAAGIITTDTAREYAVNRHRLELSLRGIVTNRAILNPDPGR